MFRFKSFALISKVLFEINSFARVEKTNSCSNTSKNAARLYFYKEQFLSYSRGLAFRLSPRFRHRFSRWESGAKVSVIFEPPNLFERFFRIFSEPFFASLQTFCLIRSGCKGKSNFRISKRFWNFFQNFSEPFSFAPKQCFSLEAGAKIRAFRDNFQIIRELFSVFFAPGYALLYYTAN